MEVKLYYFGMIAEVVHKDYEILTITAPIEIKELKKLLTHRYPILNNKKYRIAVNQSLTHKNQMIYKNDEIALLPPFAGG